MSRHKVTSDMPAVSMDIEVPQWQRAIAYVPSGSFGLQSSSAAS